MYGFTVPCTALDAQKDSCTVPPAVVRHDTVICLISVCRSVSYVCALSVRSTSRNFSISLPLIAYVCGVAKSKFEYFISCETESVESRPRVLSCHKLIKRPHHTRRATTRRTDGTTYTHTHTHAHHTMKTWRIDSAVQVRPRARTTPARRVAPECTSHTRHTVAHAHMARAAGQLSRPTPPRAGSRFPPHIMMPAPPPARRS